MLRKVVSVGGFLLLVGILIPMTPGSAQAANRAFAGVRLGGFGGGFYRGGFYGRPYAAFGYRPYYRMYGYAYPYQWGYSAYPFNFNYGAYNSYYYVPPSTWDDWKFSDHDADLSATYLPPSTAPAGGYQSFYSATSLPADAKASFTVNVPVDAELWFDGQPTTAMGLVREFESGPLQPGSQYAYEIQAHWKEKGRPITQTRTVIVPAGGHVTVTFPIRSRTS
jgi:uncharacterized protein (TIGR03000 family)